MKKAVVLLSGGVDSTVCMAVARSEGFDIYSITFDYGQRHRCEIESAKKIAQFFGVRDHLIFKVDLRSIGGSALVSDVDVPKRRRAENISTGIPATYVPARNMIFLSVATAYAETIGAGDIFAGMNSIDYSGYPDCRPEFVEAFEKMVNLGTKTGVEGGRIKINVPLIDLKKKEIIELGGRLDVDWSLTWSCYDPVAVDVEASKSRVGERAGDFLACGECDSCLLRLKGFAEAGINDPIQYVQR